MSTQSFRDRLTFLEPKFEIHVINGQDVHFYPISMAMLFKLRKIAKPIAQALRVLFTQDRADHGQTFRRIGNDTETIVTAISPDLARLRADQQDAALTGLIDALTDEKNADVIGELLVDSLRDQFPRGTMKPADCAAFLKELDVVEQREMLVGLARGNAKILGPFGDLLTETLTRVSGRVESALVALKKADEETKATETVSSTSAAGST